MSIFKVINWAKSKLFNWSKLGVQKKANLDQLITLKICARNFFVYKRCVETPIFIVFFDNRCFVKKTNLDQLIALKTPKLGPVNNSTAMYVYLCIYVLKSY